MSKYGKAIASTLFAVLIAAYATFSGDQNIEPAEWVAIAIAATGAAGTYLVPLAPQFRWGKDAVNALLAILQVLATVILGGLDSNEWILLVLAAGQALGVAVTPAVSDNGISSKNPVVP